MTMQDNRQNPKTLHHSEEKMVNAFQATDATKEHYREMRLMIKAERARRCIAEFQNADLFLGQKNGGNNTCHGG